MTDMTSQTVQEIPQIKTLWDDCAKYVCTLIKATSVAALSTVIAVVDAIAPHYDSSIPPAITATGFIVAGIAMTFGAMGAVAAVQELRQKLRGYAAPKPANG